MKAYVCINNKELHGKWGWTRTQKGRLTIGKVYYGTIEKDIDGDLIFSTPNDRGETGKYLLRARFVPAVTNEPM